MKTLGRALLFVGMFILAVASLGRAQESQAQNTDLLREKIEQLEKVDIRTVSSSVQDRRNSKLLLLYEEYISALQRDIEALKKIQEISGSDRDSKSELSRLLGEQNRIADKVRALRNEPPAAVASAAPAPKASSATPKPQIQPVVLRPNTENDPPPASAAILETDSLSRMVATQESSIKLEGLPHRTEGTLRITVDKSTVKGPALMIKVEDKKKRQVDAKRITLKWDRTVYEPKVQLAVGTNTITVSDVGSSETATLELEGTPGDPDEADNLMLPRGPVGLMIGGNVISNQSQNFSQADPFFGFIAGYTSRRRGLEGRAGSFNLRFQGIFSSAPRTAAAPEEDPDDPNVPNIDLPFLSSRKSFDTDLHFWWEFPVLGSKFFTLGPYAGIGASTVLDKNELRDEEVSVTSESNAVGDNTELDTSQVKTDNDLKKYYEYGLILNIYLPNRGLFLQSTLTKANYEALAGLYKDEDGFDRYNTKKRFHGRVTIFPLGLARGFGVQTRLTPMFGIDLNASRGPDSLRFFSGFALSLKGIPTPTEEAATPPPADGENAEQ